jgi:hypothetical protein
VPTTTLRVDGHPLLRLAAFTTRFPAPLGRVATPAAARDALRPDAPAPVARDEAVRAAVRDLLRHGGYKPTGRGKPAAEYLARAAAEGTLGPINAAVDACNAASLHSGLPISVVDTARARPPFRVGIAPAGRRTCSTPRGQAIDLGGPPLPLRRRRPVRERGARRAAHEDARRDDAHVQRGVGVRGVGGRLADAARWYRALLHDAGAETEDAEVAPA